MPYYDADGEIRIAQPPYHPPATAYELLVGKGMILSDLGEDIYAGMEQWPIDRFVEYLDRVWYNGRSGRCSPGPATSSFGRRPLPHDGTPRHLIPTRPRVRYLWSRPGFVPAPGKTSPGVMVKTRALKRDYAKELAYIQGRVLDVRNASRTPAPTTPAPSTGDNKLDTLQQLGELRDSGVLTEDEFNRMKTEIIEGPTEKSE